MQGYGNLLLLLVLFVPLALVFNRQRKQQREMSGLQQRLAPGQQVMTTSGLYARLVEVDGDVVVLETGPGQQQRWARPAIARIVEDVTSDGHTDVPADDSPA